MKKLTLLFAFVLLALCAQAAAVDSAASYVYSSDFDQIRAGASIPIGLSANVGLEGKYVYDKNDTGYKDDIYSVYLPIRMDFSFMQLQLVPFYYFKTKAENNLFPDAYAYGVTSTLFLKLREDEVNELYTQAYIGVSYARQKAAVWHDADWEKEIYDQTAFTLGLRQNFFGSFTFQVAGTAYQYPDGVTNVESFRGIMDQNDMAFTQSYDISRELGKYALSARITRFWPEQRSSLYIGYHYAEFYTADPQHSILVGNTFYIAQQARIDMAYNHLQTTSSTNKRDLFYINLSIAF